MVRYANAERSNVILSEAKELCPAIHRHVGRFFASLRMTVAEMLRATVGWGLALTAPQVAVIKRFVIERISVLLFRVRFVFCATLIFFANFL